MPEQSRDEAVACGVASDVGLRWATAVSDYKSGVISGDQRTVTCCRFFVCSCSLFKHGVAQKERRNLGNLDPIYERDLTKLGVYQREEGG